MSLGRFKYQIIRRGPFTRTTTISINSGGEVIVRTPSWVPLWEIEHFIQLKYDWISKKLKHYQEKPQPSKKKFTDGEPHLLFGVQYPLKVASLPYISHPRLKFSENVFQAVVPEGMSALRQKKELRELMLKLYLDHGKKIINEKVYFYTQKLGVVYNRIVLKNVSSIWGSCSRLNNLNFNRKLVMAPHEVVDYVVIHEVCHLVHHHHRHQFWDLVNSLCPQYKLHIRWLKENQSLLSL